MELKSEKLEKQLLTENRKNIKLLHKLGGGPSLHL